MKKRVLLTGLMACYCLFVVMYLVTEYSDKKGIHTYFAKIGNPFLEQHWNMFAPNPPAADKRILVQVFDAEGQSMDSTWLELTGSIRERNKYHFFGSSQRLIKYLHGTLNPVLKSYQEEILDSQGETIVPSKFQQLSSFKALDAYIRLTIARSRPDFSSCSYYKLRVLHSPVAPIEDPAAERITYIIMDTDLIAL